MFAIQNEIGPAAARTFIPQFNDSKPLPQGLDSYTLFLVPDPRWRNQDYRSRLASIWNTFYDFGRSIGDTQLAIWFLDADGNVDIQRSQLYCDRLGLSYNDGP